MLDLDGAYVCSRHPRLEWNFEFIVGKVMDKTGQVTRCAAVRHGGAETVQATRQALQQHGIDLRTTVTVLTDGDSGLRAVQHHIAPQAEYVLDWFHIAMRFEQLKQVAKGMNGQTDGVLRYYAFWHSSNG